MLKRRESSCFISSQSVAHFNPSPPKDFMRYCRNDSPILHLLFRDTNEDCSGPFFGLFFHVQISVQIWESGLRDSYLISTLIQRQLRQNQDFCQSWPYWLSRCLKMVVFFSCTCLHLSLLSLNCISVFFYAVFFYCGNCWSEFLCQFWTLSFWFLIEIEIVVFC